MIWLRVDRGPDFITGRSQSRVPLLPHQNTIILLISARSRVHVFGMCMRRAGLFKSFQRRISPLKYIIGLFVTTGTLLKKFKDLLMLEHKAQIGIIVISIETNHTLDNNLHCISFHCSNCLWSIATFSTHFGNGILNHTARFSLLFKLVEIMKVLNVFYFLQYRSSLRKLFI